MDKASQQTGTQDKHYDLISVLYHMLQGAEVYGQYCEDAEAAGDEELSQFFEDCQSQCREIAARAKQVLAKRLGGFSQSEEERVDEASEESFPASDAPAH